MSKEYEKFTYVTTKTELEIDKLNSQIEQAEHLLKGFHTDHNDYKTLLVRQIELLEKKNTLLNKAIEETNAGLKNLKTKPLGVINQSELDKSYSHENDNTYLKIDMRAMVLEPTEGQKQKIENYNKAFEELPTLEIAISVDGGETLKFDLKKFYSLDLEDNEVIETEVIETKKGECMYDITVVLKDDTETKTTTKGDFVKKFFDQSRDDTCPFVYIGNLIIKKNDIKMISYEIDKE